MEKPFMEVIRFDSSDVILTSGGHSVNGLSVYCPAGHNDNGDTHFHLEGIGYSEIYQCKIASGHAYVNQYGVFPDEPSGGYFKGEFPTEPDDIGKWYYLNGDKYELCNSGK